MGIHELRRFRDRQPKSLFRGGELPKLMAMIVMLAVLAMAITRARDPGTWRWLTGEAAPDDRAPADAAPTPASGSPADGDRKDKPSEETPAKSDAAPVDSNAVGTHDAAGDPPVRALLPLADRETDLDAEEADAAQEELEIVAQNDKIPLNKADMFAYWRFFKWQRNQSFEEMRNRAVKVFSFTEVYETPNRFRGKLLSMRLRVIRALTWPAEENELGVKQVYELMGWNDDSNPNCYTLVCSELPQGFPAKGTMSEDVTFVGYFLKLWAFDDHGGKTRALPLLIGRISWTPTEAAVHTGGNDWWIWLLGGAMIVLFFLRWGLPLLTKKRARTGRLPSLRLNAAAEEIMPVELWLERSEQPAPTDEIKHPANHDQNGNGAGSYNTPGLDGTAAGER